MEEIRAPRSSAVPGTVTAVGVWEERVGGAGTIAREEVMGAEIILEAMAGGVELAVVGAGEGNKVPAHLLVDLDVDIEGPLM
jgi:hypothetical protein